MKHQVFLLLLFYSFSVYSMDPNKISQEQIVAGLIAYKNHMEQHFPHSMNWQALGQDIEIIRNMELSAIQKKEILEDMKLLPSTVPLGDKLILLEQCHEAIK